MAGVVVEWIRASRSQGHDQLNFIPENRRRYCIHLFLRASLFPYATCLVIFSAEDSFSEGYLVLYVDTG